MLVALVVATLGISLFQFSTIRPGHPWGDDFAMYILEARNIATWHSFTDTGYIYNPARPRLGPRAYPPGFPLVLAPAYRVAGLRLGPMKAEVTLFFVAAVSLLALLFRPDLPAPFLLFFVLLLGFSPLYFEFKNEVLSDLPFLFFVALGLLLARREADWSRHFPTPILYGLVLGAVLYLAYATRALGVVVVPTVVGADLVRTHRLSRSVLVAVVVFGLLALVQSLLLGSTLSYFDQLHPSWSTIGHNIRKYPRSLVDLWRNGRWPIGARVVLWATGALAAIGFVTRLRHRSMDVIAFFPILYPIPLVIWPAYNIRYLIPWIPFFLFFAVRGLYWLGDRLAGKPGTLVALPLAAAVVFASYGGQYTRERFGPFRGGVGSPQAMAFFDFVRTHTEPTAVFVISKPRAFALFTGRRASALQERGDPAELWGYVERIGASYVVEGPTERGHTASLVRSYSTVLRPVFRNGTFELFAIERGPGPVSGSP